MDPVALARLNAGLRDLLVELLARRVRDPRLQAVSVTAVEVSRDLAVAKVFYSVLGPDSAKHVAQRGLEKAAGFLRREAGRHLRLRTVPELRFLHDPSLERGAHIEELLREIKAQSGEESGDGIEEQSGEGPPGGEPRAPAAAEEAEDG